MTDTGDMAAGPGQPGDDGLDRAGLRRLRVLRVCSVFEPAALNPASVRYDAIGGMQNHTAELSRCLDRMGVRQLVLTSRMDGPAGAAGFGRYARVMRTGVRVPFARQGWAVAAAPMALAGRGA